MNPLADAMAAAADAYRGVFNEGERLFLFPHAVTGSKAGFGTAVEVTSGWEKVARSFEDTSQEPPTVIVYLSDEHTRAELAGYAAWAILRDGETAGDRHLCTLEGVAQYGDEIAMRLRSTGRAGTYTLPVEEEAFAIVTSGGDTWVTDSGEEIVYQ
jgi:hypothetical protein